MVSRFDGSHGNPERIRGVRPVPCFSAVRLWTCGQLRSKPLAVPRDPQSHSLADRQIFFHEATVDAQELRRKFAQNSKSSVYRVYASAVACGTRSPVVILLDLRDR